MIWNLKDCPCCECPNTAGIDGDPSLKVYQEPDAFSGGIEYEGKFQIHCTECGMFGPCGDDKDEAHELWNWLPRYSALKRWWWGVTDRIKCFFGYHDWIKDTHMFCCRQHCTKVEGKE